MLLALLILNVITITGIVFLLAAVGNSFTRRCAQNKALATLSAKLTHIIIDKLSGIDERANEFISDSEWRYNYQSGILENLALKAGLDLNDPDYDGKPFDRERVGCGEV